MDLTAKIVQVLPPVTGTGKNGEWRKQNIILETDGMYPKKVCMTIWGDKISDAILKEGQLVTASFDVESREYNGNWYTDLRAWRVVPSDGSIPDGNSTLTQQTAATPPPVDFGDASGDDLPF